MASNQKNRIQGLDALIKKINKLGDPKLQKKAFVKGLRAAAKPILKVARAKAPRGKWRDGEPTIFPGVTRSKHLRNALSVKVKSKKFFHVAYVGAKINKPINAYHHAMIEGGRKATGGHPGITGKHYLERAYETTSNQVEKAIDEAVEKFFKEMTRG